jgi:hypothetical protein
MRTLLQEFTLNRTVGGVAWTGALLVDEGGAYWMGVHTTTGADSWNSTPALLKARTQAEASDEVGAQLIALAKRCTGAA